MAQLLVSLFSHPFQRRDSGQVCNLSHSRRLYEEDKNDSDGLSSEYLVPYPNQGYDAHST